MIGVLTHAKHAKCPAGTNNNPTQISVHYYKCTRIEQKENKLLKLKHKPFTDCIRFITSIFITNSVPKTLTSRIICSKKDNLLDFYIPKKVLVFAKFIFGVSLEAVFMNVYRLSGSF